MIALLLAAVTLASPVTLDGLPVGVEPGDGWKSAVRGATSLTVSRDVPSAEFMLSFESGVQPELDDVAMDEIREVFEAEFSDPGGEMVISDLAVNRVDHATLGVVVAGSADGQVKGVPLPVRMRFAMWAGPAGIVTFVGGTYTTAEQADSLFADALDRVVWVEEPMAHDDFSWDRAEFDGYALDVPEGWRAAHRRERKYLGLDKEHQAVLDPRSVDLIEGFMCVVNDGPLEVLDPELSELHANNFRVRTRAYLSGGAYRSRGGGAATVTKVTTSGAPVKVAEDEQGQLELVRLGDRDGYLWRVSGSRGDETVEALVVYTTFGTSNVDCVYVAEPGSESFEAVEASFRRLEVTDGRPPYETFHGTYLKTWPFRHPLLQAWWFAGVFVLIGLVASWRVMR